MLRSGKIRRISIRRKKVDALGLILIIEALFAGGYVSITRSYFFLMLAERGFTFQQLAYAGMAAAILMIIAGKLAYSHSDLLQKNFRTKLLALHLSERLLWGAVAAATAVGNIALILLLYAAAQAVSAMVSVMMNTVIFSSFDEAGVRKVTGYRNAMALVSTLTAQGLAFTVLYLIKGFVKYLYLYGIAVFLGLIAWSALTLAPIKDPSRPVKEMSFEERVEATDLFIYLCFLLGSANLLGMVWSPYIVKVLGAPSYLAALINIAGTLAAIAGSIVWSRARYSLFFVGMAVNASCPLLILLLNPFLHPLVAAASSFSYTAANFVGAFLYASISKAEGPARSAARLVTANAVGFLIASTVLGVLGLGPREAIIAVAMLKLGALLTAALTLKEVSPLPDAAVRAYSRIIYYTSAMSYKASVDITTKYLYTAFKLALLVIALVLIFVVYRVAFLLLWGAGA